MASGLPVVVVLVLCVSLAPSVSGGDSYCESYIDSSNTYRSSQNCGGEFCCGSCSYRYCCNFDHLRLEESVQDDCDVSMHSPLPMAFGISGFVIILLIAICCCVCPCCCLYKMCRKPRPVIATTTHTTVVTTTPQQQYPQQPVASPGHPQSYQGVQYPPYQPVPVQSGYGNQPVPQGYGPQPMLAVPYQGQPFTPGPPPTYQEAIGPVYPPNPMPYSQAAFNPGQPSYPLQPPVQSPQPNAPPTQSDFLGQPAYNPDYVANSQPR